MRDTVPAFVDTPLVEILAHVQRRLDAGDESVSFLVPDPDLGRGHHAGEVVKLGQRRWIHRPLRVWTELADRLGLRCALPRPASDGLVLVRLQQLDPSASWDGAAPSGHPEKYGAGSGFARIAKHEDPGFVLDFADALERARLPANARILDLGVNDGDELALLLQLQPALRDEASLVGVDHSASALAVAGRRFPSPRHRFIEADLGDLARLELGRFDLVLSIGTLHSPGVPDREILRHVVQHALNPGGAVIFGFPNCRYQGGELLHGARTKNFSQPELSLLFKGVAFYRRYLQQHRFSVFVTGHHEILVTGRRRDDAERRRAGAVPVPDQTGSTTPQGLTSDGVQPSQSHAKLSRIT